MKNIQKFIVPILVVLVVAMVYFFYLNPNKGIGSFADFDTNNNANKDVKVYVAQEREVLPDPQGGIVFYGRDRAGQVVKIQAGGVTVEQIRSAETVTLRGHLHKDYFHAAEVIPE
ncbi:MAG: hypothetical protein HRU80_14210 [Ignavibacteriales bacterium]|nr:MAG: hypothetical protein HRU80_14210 [Ignavibacteriales bacterium]